MRNLQKATLVKKLEKITRAKHPAGIEPTITQTRGMCSTALLHLKPYSANQHFGKKSLHAGEMMSKDGIERWREIGTCHDPIRSTEQQKAAGIESRQSSARALDR